MTARPNHYMGPRMREILRAYQELPPATPRRRAAELIGCSYYSLNSVIRNARRAGLYEDPPDEDVMAEATHLMGEVAFLMEGGASWAEASRRVGVVPRTRLARAVNQLRRTA